MNEELAGKLKSLRLGGLLAHWDDYLKLAADQRFSHGRLLTHVLEEEYRIKREKARQLRLKRARLPEPWVIETFPFDCWDCLLIDEIGCVEVEPVQVGLFFTLMHKRHKKRPTLITSNLGFSDWGSFLKNNHLTAALIDRLTENSHVINMKQCVSLRPKLPSEP
jgi:hypothetical protein